MKKWDLLICGGGVIGLSIAYEAARNGARVAIVESGLMGRGSSWAGAGILPAGATVHADDPTEQLRSLAHKLHREWAGRLLDETGIDNEYRQCGGLYLARTAAERATLAANRFWLREHGIRAESLTLELLRSNFADLCRDQCDLQHWDALYVPDDCRLRNPRHLKALEAACRRYSVEIFEQTPVRGIEFDRHNVLGLQTQDCLLEADKYCIAAGAWTRSLLMPLGIETGIMPIRGQMLLYELPKVWFYSIINEGHRYMVPREDGHLLIGSCEEEVGFDAATTESMLTELKSWALGICPALKNLSPVRWWAGLRPGSFDSFPYMGQVTPFDNLYLASGHFRHGIHWSTATAVLMYQLMFGVPTSIDLNPFRVHRGHAFSNTTLRSP